MRYKAEEHNENGRFRLSDGTMMSVDTMNTRDSSVLLAAEKNFGLEQKEIDKMNKKELKAFYQNSSSGILNGQRLENVPLSADYADKLNKDLRVAKIQRDKKANEGNKRTVYIGILVVLLVLLMGLFAATIVILA